MKKMNQMVMVLGGVTAIGLCDAVNADVLLLEDFEDATVTYTTSVPEFSDGGGDFWLRTNGSNHSGGIVYNNVQGDFYFAGMDLDGDGVSIPITQTFGGINIAGYSDLEFSIYLGEDDDGSNQDWDDSDHVHIAYQIDDGGFQDLLWIENDGSEFNSAPLIDTDFDGTGDGTEITDTLTQFFADIAGTGNTLEIQITWNVNAGEEDLTIDNVMVTGNIPAPGALAMLGLAGFAGTRRRRK